MPMTPDTVRLTEDTCLDAGPITRVDVAGAGRRYTMTVFGHGHSLGGSHALRRALGDIRVAMSQDGVSPDDLEPMPALPGLATTYTSI